MSKRTLVFLMILATMMLWGCGDKLTEEIARQVIEKEVLTKSKVGSFTKIAFGEGSDGFDYFQKLISDGSFILEKKEQQNMSYLSKEKVTVKIYAPKPELAHIFKKLEIMDVVDNSKVTSDMLMWGAEEKKLPMITICKTFCRIKQDSVQSIDTIFNDDKNGTAKVKFTIAEVGIAPYYDELRSLMYPGESEPTGNYRLRKPYTTEIQLKKYDEGWSMDLNPS